MPLPISTLPPISPATAPRPAAPPHSAQPGGFSSVLEGAIQAVEGPGKAAGQAIQNMLAGDGGELHSVALAVERADVAFDLAMQVRNKVVSAYQEIMRMQL